MFSTAEYLSTTLDLSNSHAALGFEDRNVGYTNGFGQLVSNTWGAFEFTYGELRAHSTDVTSSTVSNDVLSDDIPAGSLACAIQFLQWNDGGYVDCYGVTAANASIYLQRIDMKNEVTTSTGGDLFSSTRTSARI